MNAAIGLVIILVSLVVSFKAGEHKGYLQAESRVLKISPPSQELELACLGLWIGDQTKKYEERSR